MPAPRSGLLPGLTVAVTGATGNVGTALLRALASAGVTEVRGLARRQPPDTAPYAGVRWSSADLGEPDSAPVLAGFLTGADVVVHLAWALQPGRQPERLRRVNVEGTQRVLDAAAAAGVPHVVHMSSLGVYSAGPHDRRIAEDWPAEGMQSSHYSRDKVEAEHRVRDFVAAHPDVTVSVTRPTLVLQPEAGSEIGRYFLGDLLLAGARLLPGAVAKRLPLPLPGTVSVAFVHADDVAGSSTAGPADRSTWRRSRRCPPTPWRRRSARSACRPRPPCCAPRWTSLSGPTWCRPSPAGWTSGWASHCWTPPGPGQSWTGPRPTAGTTCCASSSPPWAGAKAPTARCCSRRAARSGPPPDPLAPRGIGSFPPTFRADTG
jgi:nucleoside-diphosphate-sugar epimerase